jgi:hypothetical protein
MISLRSTSEPAPCAPSSSTRVVEALAGLAQLFEPEVNVVVVARPPRSALERAAEGLRAGSWSSLSVVLEAPHDEASRTRPIPSVRGVLPPGIDPAPLEEELWGLAEVLADLTGAGAVGLRLARLDRAMCPRFHVDHVAVRCVATYSGPSTEWLDHHAVNRAVLGHLSGGRADEVSGLILPGAAPRTAPAGAAVFLKGERWPGNDGRGAVHRSPAVPAGQARLVATLDPLD